MGFPFWLFMPWTCPKSWPRGRCSLREGGGGSISRAVAHIFRSQRQGSGDSAPCALYPGPPCWTEFSSFYGRFSRGRRGKSKNRPKNRISGLVEPLSAVFRPYFHVLAVAEASSRPLRVFCSDNWVSPLPSVIFRNPIILSSWVQRHGSGDDPRAVLGSLAASGRVCIATTCGS